jgi:hypothetical protein
VLLISDPRDVVASYIKSRAEVTADDIGLPQQAALYDELDAAGVAPLVIDAGDFLRRPEAHLRALCDWLGIDFTDRMLHWPKGPRDSDGIWAPHWYTHVWESTGFEAPAERDVVLSGQAADVAAACRPHYDRLYAKRLTSVRFSRELFVGDVPTPPTDARNTAVPDHRGSRTSASDPSKPPNPTIHPYVRP